MQRRGRGASCARRDSAGPGRARRRPGRKRQRQRPEGRRGPRWRHQGQEAAEAGSARGGARGKCSGVAAAAAEESPPIGTVKIWPTINILTGGVSLSTFTLQGVGDKIEIWVANNLNFPAGDCRNDGIRNVITPAQVSYFTDQFDDNIEPKMSAAFSSPPSRDGTGALLEQLAPSLVPGGLLQGPGQQDRHPDRQLPGRELLGHHLPVLRRGLPLLRHQQRSSTAT